MSKFYKNIPNPIHAFPAFANKEANILNCIIEINSGTLNKYEIQNSTGILKLDRVGYSSLTYPFAYGGIPSTWDLDNDPLDIEIISVTEPLQSGCLVEARIIGVMKFIDSGEIDDKIIAVLADDKRVSHIQTFADLGEQFVKETTYYWEHYKDLKKAGSGQVLGFFGIQEALKIVEEAEVRYKTEVLPKLV